MAIDTLAYARRLREAGFSEEQAEGQAQALAAAMIDTLATKQDLREALRDLEVRMDARFAQVDARFTRMEDRFEYLERHLDTRLVEQERRSEIRIAELERRIEIRFSEQSAHLDGRFFDMERRMTVRLGGMVVAGIGVFSVLAGLL